MEPLNQKKCEACEGIGQALTQEQIKNLMPQLHSGWEIKASPDRLVKRFQFKNFYHTMGFANALAYLANQENHHPDLSLGYNYCEVNWTTHALNGLSMNDFICASKTDKL
jgi:4a-hydroxytetrahydrobiopterin dehydratase